MLFRSQRPGHAERGLPHQGGLVFNPVGAEAVQIRFDGQTLIVEDGPVLVRAKKV